MVKSTKDRLEIEEKVRSLFNKLEKTDAKKLPRKYSKLTHEFDLYEEGNVIGGVTTSPWWNKTEKHTSNSGGQDRASTELLWLTMWNGNEHRVLICTEKDMAENLLRRWKGCRFPERIDICYCDLPKQKLDLLGTL